MDDRKRIVAAGYDAMAEAYLAQFGVSSVRAHWLGEFTRLVTPPGRILDLGCGAGEPVARSLGEAGFDVVGVDVSERQVKLARRKLPSATFHHGDMIAIELPPASFDGVAAFYSMNHLPQAEHSRLFRKVETWLKPRGIFIASFGVGPSGDWRGPWLGVEMYFSHSDAEASLELINDAGLSIERFEVMPQDNEPAEFLWILARKLRCS